MLRARMTGTGVLLDVGVVGVGVVVEEAEDADDVSASGDVSESSTMMMFVVTDWL